MKYLISSLRLWVSIAVLVSPALAQDLRPRIVFIFDTSGSMGVDIATGIPTGGDNSERHPGDGNLSRLFVAKSAVSALIETTSEVQFALMRYPQAEGAGLNSGRIGGFQQNTYEGLEETPLNYAGGCVGQLSDPTPDQASSLLVPLTNDNELDILRWMDGHEDWPGDPELRADGPTPILTTLALADQYLRGVIRNDPVEDCRPYAVVLLTDGGESCVPAMDRAEALAERATLLQMSGVKTYVVAFGVGQNDLGVLSALARAGGTAVNRDGRLDLRRGLPYEANDLRGLRAAFSRILEDAIPVEACNDLDDDCDGRIDEGVLNSCGMCGPAPVEACDGVDQDCDHRIDEGALNACGGCGAVPDEVCNGVDDDCDGAVDEAVANACGGCAGVRVEICNALDDDCDGIIDNMGDGPIARACGTEIGACSAGVEQCVAGEWQVCDGVAAVDEACNDADDDCDGVVDEDDVACGPALDIGDVGECRVGARRCDPAACATPGACEDDGWLVDCEGAVGPSEEICDGRDNDCDGMPDEGLFNACGRCGPTPPESCNGADDNCDGRIDEDAVCPTGYICFSGECVQRCDQAGECGGDFRCHSVYPGGLFCHPNPCAGVDCGPGRRCDPEQAACIDPCADVDCEGGQGCDLGECVPATCRHTGCPTGQVCRGDLCVGDDPCAAIDCGPEAFCRGGDCVPACIDNACGPDLTCRDGECVADPCGGRCLRSQRCDATDGACVADACAGIACPEGMACEDGACSVDAACAAIDCPPGTRCFDAMCTDFTPGVAPIPSRERPRFDAGLMTDGAVQDAGPSVDARPDADAPAPTPPADPPPDDCATAPGAPAGWFALLLLLPLIGRRRWLCALALLGACDDANDTIRLASDFGGSDSRPIDATIFDARTGCRPSPEICDTIDNDCDGLVDGDDPDLQTQLLVDPDNCGRCDAACVAPNARFACQAGECIIVECAPGFGDYNANIADGCEADCVITAGGVEICDETDNDCDGRLDEGFDLQGDLSHCGGCNLPCDPTASARATCDAGACAQICERGFVDLDGDASNGCEYACETRGDAELCNGLDDDCDGAVDETDGLAPPEEACGEVGLCAAQCGADGECGDDACMRGVCVPRDVIEVACDADADCQAEHPGLACIKGICVARSRSPMCDGVAGYRCVRPVGWQFGDETGACDGDDNDCDGRTDEDFAARLFEADRATPSACFVGLGLCQREGLSECSADGSAVVCSARPGPPDDPDDDDCDGIDDDCDGALDEGHLDSWRLVGAAVPFEIYTYEASRPGATPAIAGRDVDDDDASLTFLSGRACSRPGVLPWADVSWPEAEAACQIAGGRLCTGDEWSAACGVGYPYGPTFDAQACNGGGYDVDLDADGVQDGLLHTGRLDRCERGGVFDLSGNLKEWTAEQQDGLRLVRGGGYESNVPAGLACDQRNDLKAEGFRHPGIGFRCCR
ncbi:MAG: hypothetical protein ACI9U2_003347 [Bradymonadia bacterium]